MGWILPWRTKKIEKKNREVKFNLGITRNNIKKKDKSKDIEKRLNNNNHYY